MIDRWDTCTVKGDTFFEFDESNLQFRNIYLTLYEEDGKLLRIDIHNSKRGSVPHGLCLALAGLINVMLAREISREEIADVLEGIYAPNPLTRDGKTYLSIPDFIAQVLRDWVPGQKLIAPCMSLEQELIEAMEEGAGCG